MSTTETNDGPPTKAARFCQHCGTALPGGRFCPGCGRPVDPAEHSVDAGAIAHPDAAADGVAHLDAPAAAADDEAPTTAQPAITAHSADDDGRPVDDPTAANAPSAAGAFDSETDRDEDDRPGVKPPTAAEESVRPPRPPAAESPFDRPQHSATAAAPAARPRRGLIIGAGIAVLAAAAVLAVLLLTSKDGGGASADTAYREQVAKTFGPVLGANRDLSNELARLRGTKPTDARVAAHRAQQATTLATGALGALNTPTASEQLARDARQVLDREGAYLSAITAVLANPSSPTRGQLETLSSNLTSAMSAAGPTVAGTSQTVSGADRLAAWAPQTARTLKRREQAKKRKQSSSKSSSGSGSSSSAPSHALSNGRSCGSGVYAGPNTSCEFAFNVRDAYYDAPGATASVRVFSPVTGATYTMNCSPSGSGVTCSGANDASVAF